MVFFFKEWRKNIKGVFTVFVSVIFLLPIIGLAQDNRSYFYENISQKFTVNKDTTVLVEETQTYNFSGEYHKGWRSIPLNKVSAITDVVLIDGLTLIPLKYVSRSLEKTDPNSWGKYTYRNNDGNLEIEWYYDAIDTSRTWILKYKLIGSLSFLKDKDELYWNLFSDYDVPVGKADAVVIIPGNTYSPNDFQATIYAVGAQNPKYEILNNRTFYFSAENIIPKGVLTIAVGWPKGLIDRGAFWGQFFKAHYVLFSNIAIILLTIISMILYWYYTEKRGKGRGTIIAEYAPPRNLPPAMAELIVKERITPMAWSATVIDLAVRGYLKISEDKQSGLLAILRYIFGNIVFVFPLMMVLFLIFGNFASSVFLPFILLALLAVFVIRIVNGSKSVLPKDYIVESIKNWMDDSGLNDYERKFLSALLTGEKFSTKAMRGDHTKGRAMYLAMKKVQERLYEETDTKTGAYDKPVTVEKYKILLVFILYTAFFTSMAVLSITNSESSLIAVVAVTCAVFALIFFKFEARLSAEGAILREEWLGFKLYLQTAEKYRLQNLAPETFEKYLPYAIIFGVEKQWGSAFDGISIAPPSWYHGAYVGNISGTYTAGFSSGFSAGAFSASFSSSFSSAFSSSGGGGASGGGGGAGGGGGGGGGGAS